MATNNFKAFALDPNANVMSQADWEALPALLSGFTAGKASSAQVNKAIRQATTIGALIGQFIANAELDALDDGDIDGLVAKLATAITTNLGLGEGSALPVGVPVPWPSAVPPAGWMKCNGSTFNLASYPALAAVFPSGVLPDLRGEFIRGWDDGRGVDTGRGILSAQGDAIRNIVGSISGLAVLETGTAKGAIKITASSNTSRWEGVTSGRGLIRDLDFDSSGTPDVNVAKEVRPRNIAFNYIVRAV